MLQVVIGLVANLFSVARSVKLTTFTRVNEYFLIIAFYLYTIVSTFVLLAKSNAAQVVFIKENYKVFSKYDPQS